ncbi:MAG: polyphosphate kinase [Alphaproteobacteria bacterium]|nr:MAG: polyphosphate kinase [Alphaproteobacteria bacterium]
MLSKTKYINRELSWLEFNQRVLEEAENSKIPLAERLNFLSISGSNLDEFFMVRVAGLKGQVDSEVFIETIDGLMPEQVLYEVIKKSKFIKKKQNECWENILKELSKNGIKVCETKQLNVTEKRWLKTYFVKEIFPLLTPVAIDPAHPFPFVPNLGLSIVLKLKSKKSKNIIRVVIPFPKGLKKFIKINNINKFIATENIIIFFIDQLFPKYTFISYGAFRLIRDSDIEFSDEAEDLVTTFENQLRKRRYGREVLLEMTKSIPEDLKNMIINSLDINRDNIIYAEHILDISSANQITSSVSKEHRWKDFKPRFPERIKDANDNCFAAIRYKDMIIHHPYESFDVVVKFLRQAAKDKKVLVIKQTIYRTAKENNEIIEALVEAAEEGKSVTALLEIKARFDEEVNIKVARYLKRYGVQVVYGSINLKTHAKISLVVRRERKGLNTYVHFGTGNYHINTAKVYTDLSLFTCNKEVAEDAQQFFNMATGYASPSRWRHLSVAPDNLRNDILTLIDNEISNKVKGKKSEIWFKCNSLIDEEVINKLYKASQIGVKIELIVRGVCCLRPQIKGLSENISVRSIVGRFLEHSRIYCFSNGHSMPSSKAKIFISSADIMPRNFDRRYEVMVPILNQTVHKQILNQIMVANLKDNTQAWEMKSSGEYSRIKKVNHYSAHNYFMSNPSLSGRGKSIKIKKPKDLVFKNK